MMKSTLLLTYAFLVIYSCTSFDKENETKNHFIYDLKKRSKIDLGKLKMGFNDTLTVFFDDTLSVNTMIYGARVCPLFNEYFFSLVKKDTNYYLYSEKRMLLKPYFNQPNEVLFTVGKSIGEELWNIDRPLFKIIIADDTIRMRKILKPDTSANYIDNIEF